MKKLATLFCAISMLALGMTPAQAASEAVNSLNGLIHTAKDAQDGYYASAQQVRSAELKNLFLALSKEREQFVRELEQQVTKLGGDPSARGTIEGATYRGWINVKTALTKNDDRAVLAEVEKAEAVAVERYDETLQEQALPQEAQPIIQKQAEQVRSTKQLISELEDAAGNNVDVKNAIEAAKQKGIDVPDMPA